MRILVSEKLSENRFKTPEGYLICTNAILARTGKQTYLRREVFGDSCKDADNEIEVDRTADEVFSSETIASFENKPLCVEHPDEDVNAENHNLLSVGYVRDVKKDTVDGQDVMTATLVITDKYGIDEVESGRKTDLSCGYDCDIVDEDHPQQRHIRGNHVAICERGRAGIARIVDSAPPRGYKITGNNYAWELAGTAKDKKEAVNKFARKYQELEDVWAVSELLNYMIRNNKDVERDTELGYALHFDYDEDTKKFYIAFVEKKHRYDDSIKDEQYLWNIGFVDRSDRSQYVDIIASSDVEARAIVKRQYNPYRIFQCAKIRKITSRDENNMEDNMNSIKCLDFGNTSRNIKIVREFLEKNGFKFHVQRDADAILDYIQKRTGIANADYADVLYIIKNYSNATILRDTVNDSMKKYAEDKNGRRFTLEEIEEGKVKATNAGGREKIFRSWKEAEEEFGRRGIMIFDSFYDSVEDKQPSTLGNKVLFRNRAYVIIDIRKGKDDDTARLTLRPLERFDEKDKPFEGGGDSFWDIHIERWQLDDSCTKDTDETLWKVYLTGPSDVNNIMYVKAATEAEAKKIAARNTNEEIIKVIEYGLTPLTKSDKERILRNPNRYFDSDKKIEKVVKIIKKLN